MKAVDASRRHPDDFEIVLREDDRPIDQPGAAGRCERALKLGKGNPAPVIVISRRAVNRRSDLLNETERFWREPRFFDQIAGETNELRRELVDGAHHFGRVLHVAFVMEISEMDEAAIARRRAN